MEYHLRKISEESVLYEEYYKVEAGSLKEAIDKVLNCELDSYTGAYLPETSSYTGYEEVQQLELTQEPFTPGFDIVYISDTGYVGAEELQEEKKYEQGLL